MFEKPGKNKQDKETTTFFRKYIASFFVLNPFPSGVFWVKVQNCSNLATSSQSKLSIYAELGDSNLNTKRIAG